MTIRDNYDNTDKHYPKRIEISKQGRADSADFMKRVSSAALPADTIGSDMVERPQMQPTVFDPGFLQWYLNKNIGKTVRIEFLIGTNIMTDRVGVIEEVGISYLVLRDQSGARILTDLYSIKFITFYD
jgi:hypothetical protein